MRGSVASGFALGIQPKCTYPDFGALRPHWPRRSRKPVASRKTPPSVATQQALKSLSVERLSTIEASMPCKEWRHASQTAAALSVITGDDIRRSGATTISETLRLARGRGNECRSLLHPAELFCREVGCSPARNRKAGCRNHLPCRLEQDPAPLHDRLPSQFGRELFGYSKGVEVSPERLLSRDVYLRLTWTK